MKQTTLTQERQYVPTIGARIRLKFSNDYTSIGLPAWSTLHCLSIDGENVTCIRSLTQNGEHDGELVIVKLSQIAPPIGWKPRYTIHCAPDKVSEVLAWFSRGIVVRQSQYIGDGSTVFQPLDNSGQPHWKFGEVTDTIKPEDCAKIFRVVKLETVHAFVSAPCRYCDGSGTHTTNPSLEEQTRATDKCEVCGLHLGFSFTEAWHDEPSKYCYPKDNPCTRVMRAGECWVCRGTGNGARYVSEMEPKERKRELAKLESEGWKVWYEKRGRTWLMERETVIKDWEN